MSTAARCSCGHQTRRGGSCRSRPHSHSCPAGKGRLTAHLFCMPLVFQLCASTTLLTAGFPRSVA